MDAEEIQRTREEKGLTRSEVASRVGITTEWLRQIEMGYRHPSELVMFDIREALDLSNEGSRPIRGKGRPRASEKTSEVEPDLLVLQIRAEALRAACVLLTGAPYAVPASRVVDTAKAFEAYIKGKEQ